MPLILAFDSKELRSICENSDVAIEKFGIQTADQLHSRLADILAAETVEDLPVGNPRKTGEHPYLNYVITLNNSTKIKFCANGTKYAFLENGELDWTKVTRIKILNIGHCNE